MVIVLALTAAYAEFSRIAVVSGALRGMGAIAAGLIVATAIKLGATLGTNRLGLPLSLGFAAATFVAVGVLRWPLAWVTPSLGVVAVAIAWSRWR
jgi:chromate transporter